MIWRDVLKVWLPVLVLGALLATLYLLFEARYARLNDVSVQIAQIQARQQLLTRYMQLLVDAETGQRGFLLTEQPEYLEPLQNALPRMRSVLQQLAATYQRDNVVHPNPVVALGELTRQRIDILEEALRHYTEWRRTGTAPVIQPSGKRVMDAIRAQVTELEGQEAARLNAVLARWRSDLSTTRWTMLAATLLSAALLVLLGSFLLRDLNRRSRESAQLKHLVDARTQELLSLSNHLQELSEREKQYLARELHDSLGSLLVATKMDVAWLHARLRSGEPELELRWKRIQESLDRGVDLKRRVVESLRPTLLDNMGLFAALRWQFDETCSRSGIRCVHRFPAAEPRFNNDAAIAIFRVAQESFTNILRHSGASDARFDIAVEGADMVFSITDNGRGVPADVSAHSRGHGIAGMRHRVRALGGTFEIRGNGAAAGTVVRVAVPIANVVLREPEARPATHITGGGL